MRSPLPNSKVKHSGKCWLLRRSLRSARYTLARWEAFLAARLRGMGFKPGGTSGRCFYHPERQVRALVHSCDFTFEGAHPDLGWVEAEMKKAFLRKVDCRLGSGSRDTKQAKMLNRAVTWRPREVEREADPRRAEILVRELGATASEAVVARGQADEGGARGPGEYGRAWRG